jgi:hypothetical protein
MNIITRGVHSVGTTKLKRYVQQVLFQRRIDTPSYRKGKALHMLVTEDPGR